MKFELIPVDTLYFGDGRAMQAGAGLGGFGCRWPAPSVIHEAVRTALLRDADQLGCKEKIKAGRLGSKQIGTRLYESLRITGPLPVQTGTIHYPTPRDLLHTDSGFTYLAPLEKRVGGTNLPAVWLRPVAARAQATKQTPPEWLPQEAYEKVLAGGRLPALNNHAHPLFWQEYRIGIQIRNEDKGGRRVELFSSEHLRLSSSTGIWLDAQLGNENGAGDESPLRGLGSVLVGGESRMCSVHPSSASPHVAQPVNEGIRTRWVLATPALFRFGWRPNWIDADEGHVLLRAGDQSRRTGEARKTWRERIRSLPRIRARLVGVCAGKPLRFSGWSLVSGGPKTTRMAVSAGSVFFFEADSEEDNKHLVRALHGKHKSDFLGEKGFGFGFCGSWEPVRAASSPFFEIGATKTGVESGKGEKK